MNPPSRHSDAPSAGVPQGVLLVLIAFLPMMAIMALAPTLPTLMARFRDVPFAVVLVPMLLTMPSLCIALLAPLAGVLADRTGRRRLLIASIALYGCGGVIPLFVDDFWAVVAGRLLIGVAEAGVITVSNALLADYYDAAGRRHWLMVQGVLGPLGASALMVGAGYLAAQGWQWPFVVYAAAFPLCIAAVMVLFEPGPATAAPAAAVAVVEQPFPVAKAVLVCSVTALTCVIYFVQPVHFSLVLKALGVADPKAIGWISAIPSAGIPLGAVLFRLSTRCGVAWQFMLVYGLEGLGLLGIGLSQGYPTALAAAFVQQLGNGLVFPLLIAWAQRHYDFEHRGRGMGWWASAFFAAQFCSPALVAGVRTLAGGLLPAFVAFGMLSLLCALVAWLRRSSSTTPVATTLHA